MRVTKELLISRTFWEKLKGELKGIDLSGIEEGRTERFFFDKEKYYVFDGKQLLVSTDGLSYEKLSDFHTQQGYTLNKKYKCGFYGDKFYIAGVQFNDGVYIASYEIESGRWDRVFASGNVEEFLNGSFCTDSRYGRLYYVFFVNKSVYIYEEVEVGKKHSWTWTGHAGFEGKITACGCCCREDKLYLSLLFENSKIENYSIEIGLEGGPGKLVMQSVIYNKKEQNIILMSTDNQILILGEQAVYDAVSRKKLDISYGKKILVGMDESPVIICREEGGYSRYRLHTDECSMMGLSVKHRKYRKN